MKKIIVAFVAGQTLQLVILLAGMNLTYTSNLFLFCLILGIAAALLLCIGSTLSMLEMIPEDIDEVPAIPQDIKVTNDRVYRTDAEGEK